MIAWLKRLICQRYGHRWYIRRRRMIFTGSQCYRCHEAKWKPGPIYYSTPLSEAGSEAPAPAAQPAT